MNEKYAKFIDLLKGLTIKIPFLEAMAQMPTYSKEILAKKRRVNEEEVIEVPQLEASFPPSINLALQTCILLQASFLSYLGV